MTPPPAVSDEELMARLQGGDDGALNPLMERWQTPLRSYLFRHTQNEAAAHDLAQDVFVRVYQHRHRYAAGARFTTWLFTIARNLALNEIRRRSRHPAESLEALTESADEAPASRQFEDKRSVSAPEQLVQDELARKFEEALAAGTEVWVYYPDGMGRSTLERSGFWKPLGGLAATTRNLRTVRRLRDMAADPADH